MFAIVAMVLFILDFFGVNIAGYNLTIAGLAFVALHLATRDLGLYPTTWGRRPAA